MKSYLISYDKSGADIYRIYELTTEYHTDDMFSGVISGELLAENIPPAIIEQAIHQLLESIRGYKILDGRIRTAATDDSSATT